MKKVIETEKEGRFRLRIRKDGGKVRKLQETSREGKKRGVRDRKIEIKKKGKQE